MNCDSNHSSDWSRITGLLFSGFMTKLYATIAAVYVATLVYRTLSTVVAPLGLMLAVH